MCEKYKSVAKIYRRPQIAVTPVDKLKQVIADKRQIQQSYAFQLRQTSYK